jgi:hypothetical protein
MNEATWQTVHDWEQLHCEECKHAQLLRFQGRPHDLRCAAAAAAAAAQKQKGASSSSTGHKDAGCDCSLLIARACNDMPRAALQFAAF